MNITTRIYYTFLIFLSMMIAQDPPDDFEFNQSVNQGFYFFLDLTILSEDLQADDWIGVFNSYDETLGG